MYITAPPPVAPAAPAVSAPVKAEKTSVKPQTAPSIRPGSLPPPPIRAAPMVIEKDKTVQIKGMQKAMVSLNNFSVIEV